MDGPLGITRGPLQTPRGEGGVLDGRQEEAALARDQHALRGTLGENFEVGRWASSSSGGQALLRPNPQSDREGICIWLHLIATYPYFFVRKTWQYNRLIPSDRIQERFFIQLKYILKSTFWLHALA